MPQQSQSNMTPSAAQYCENDSPLCELLSPMLEPWTFPQWLASMRYALDSLARTYQQQEKAKESKANEAASSAKLCGRLTIFDQLGCSSKTLQTSEPKADTSSSENLWRVDIPGAMECLPHLTAGLHTSASDGSASPAWQTPVADDCVERKEGKWNSRGEPKLSAQVLMIPTPTVCGNYNRKGASKTSGDGLATFVKKWPTPTRRDFRSGKAELNEHGVRISKTDGRAHCTCLPEMVFHRENQKDIGTLNPEWTEWLMGFPIGHTELRHSEMPKFRSKPRSRGKS
jgi:hypothetical protein